MPDEQYRNLYIDFLSNQPKTDDTREKFREILRENLEKRLGESVDRMWELPQLAIEPEGEYLSLLLESRELFVHGRFYSCVAMCGIVGERLIKDLLRVSILVKDNDAAKAPSERAFDQLEHVEVYGLINFLREAKILRDDAATAARKLGELRNRYAHSRGKDAPSDALTAIQLLHTIVEGTVSIFKDFQIKDGVLVEKRAARPVTEPRG